jgi:hypothetical protein
VRVVWLALVLAAMTAGPIAAAGRLIIEDRVVTVDQPVWICTLGAPSPAVLRVDGSEDIDARLISDPISPGEVHLTLEWPARGPLALHDALPPRPRAWALPSWGNRGYLAPGIYVLAADGFAPETLTVRKPEASERRARGLIARAWMHTEAGDSVMAARLLEGFLDLEGGSPYEEEVFLLLMDLLPYTSYRNRPKDWLSEWVALHHSHCIVGEGIRRWLDDVEDEEARGTLAEIVGGYPQTQAAAAASEWLRAGPGRGR